MAGEELQIVRLRNDFYRDGFYKMFIALALMLGAIVLVLVSSFSLWLEKPSAVVFKTDAEGRVFPPVPLNETYISTADLLQWVSTMVPRSFSYDFMNYNSQYSSLQPNFTPNGYAKLTAILNTYANPKTVDASKLFIVAVPSAAPTIFNQGLINKGVLAGRYGWWIQLPLNIKYTSVEKEYTTPLVVKALVVRISILNDLSGVAIDDLLVSKPQGVKAV